MPFPTMTRPPRTAPAPFRAKPFPPVPGGKPPMAGGKPQFRQMGGKTIPMMADGGLGTPAPIGGGPSAAAAPPVVDPDQDQDNDSPVISPEALNYHDEPRSCAPAGDSPGCQYFGDDGTCSVLKIQVAGPGACNAFLAKGGAGDQDAGGPPQPGQDMDQGGDMAAGGQQ